MGLFDRISRLFTGRPSTTSSHDAPDERVERVTGVVDTRGATGENVAPGTSYTLIFTLASWRGSVGMVRTTPLTVRKECTRDEMHALMGQIRANNVISARVRFTGTYTAELVELVNAAAKDRELAQRGAELSAAETREDPRFGTLTLHPRLRVWQTMTTWCGAPVELDLDSEEDDDLADALQAAAALWDDQEGWNERILAYAAQEQRKEDSWLGHAGVTLSLEEFPARVQLNAVSVSAPDTFIFWYESEELYGDHTLQVTGTLRDGPTDAEVEG